MLQEAPPGIDAGPVVAWLAERVQLVEPVRFSQIAGGASNLTYRVEDADGHCYVLRRPPLGSVLQSAHDMAREARIIAALADTHVPVPEVVGLCEDPEVNGAPFYVTRFVDGLVLRDREDALQLTPAARRGVSLAVADTLLTLHAVDPDAVGLGDLGRREGYVERQLRRWHRQVHEGSERPTTVLDEGHALLASAVPEQQTSAIVHGDYRLDNMITGRDGSVRAVLDWELCTLGDPLADVGLMAVYWSDPGDDILPLPSTPTLTEGFLRRDEVLRRYEAGSGLDLGRMPYYMAFGYWKLAAILEGVYSRYRAGAYGTALDGERYGELAEALADKALRAARDAVGED